MDDFTDAQLNYMYGLVLDDVTRKLDYRGVIGETFDMLQAEDKRRKEIDPLNYKPVVSS